MAENPFNPKPSGLLAALGATAKPKSDVRGILDALQDKPKTAQPIGLLTGVANDLFGPTPSAPNSFSNHGAVGDLFRPALPVNSGAMGDLFGLTKATPRSALTGAAADLFPTSPPSSPFGSLAGLTASPPNPFSPTSPPSFGWLADIVTPPPPLPNSVVYAPPPKPKPVAPQTKRRAFFSFHFDDVMRVNNVRNAWKIAHPDSSSNRSFYDSSLWEARKLTAHESIKQLIRAGVLSTSAVCVLAGSMTWDRRWVKYEIARAIIDGRGLLTVHLNTINHHQTKGPHPLGRNPLAHMGIAKLQPDKRLPPQYYLYEMTLIPDGFGSEFEQWSRYHDYTASVKKPAWLTDPAVGYVMPLSVDAAEYDYEQDHGHRNIGSWIDIAAKQAGH